MGMSRVGIVAALQREIAPLVKGWHSSQREYSGRTYRFYENDQWVAVCGGIGAEPARRATEAVIALFEPEIVYSVGFAGALDMKLSVGDLVIPRRVVDARDCSSVDTGQGEGVLVSFGSVATPEQKSKLAESFGACAVDMEAAFVARAAQARGMRFAAVKAISDESDLGLPESDAFISPDGQFNTTRFTLFVLARPWLWSSIVRLARNSRRAARALCGWLETNLGAAVTS
jgi:adenosylhomocysteine nucleosidase